MCCVSGGDHCVEVLLAVLARGGDQEHRLRLHRHRAAPADGIGVIVRVCNEVELTEACSVPG